jgi:predicted nucleotidyltransferase
MVMHPATLYFAVMKRAEIIAKLRTLKPELAREAHVSAIAIFGSVARDEARADSDVDILVEFDKVPDIFAFVDLQDQLSDLLGAKVDLSTRGGLHPALRDRILREAVYV